MNIRELIDKLQEMPDLNAETWLMVTEIKAGEETGMLGTGETTNVEFDITSGVCIISAFIFTEKEDSP